MTREMSGGVSLCVYGECCPVCGCSLSLAATGNDSHSPRGRLTVKCVGAFCLARDKTSYSVYV